MCHVNTGYRYVRKKRLVAFVLQSFVPPPPDLNVEPTWQKRSGSEVRNKRPVYVGAVVAPKRRFNIEIGGRGAMTSDQENKTRRFFRTH